MVSNVLNIYTDAVFHLKLIKC